MALLRALARMVGVVWMVALALFGLAVAMYCFDALIGLGSARPDRLLRPARRARSRRPVRWIRSRRRDRPPGWRCCAGWGR